MTLYSESSILKPVSPEQKRYLSDAYDIEPEQLERLLSELEQFMGQTWQDWVRKQHSTLQRNGLTNESIFKQIQKETTERLFAKEKPTLRQIRRTIYG